MPGNIATYNPQRTLVHDIDARVKIVLVLVFSISLFCVHSWWAIALLSVGAFICAGFARLNIAAAARTLLPLLFIFALTLLVNSFVLDVSAYHVSAMPGAVEPGLLGRYAPIALLGNFGFVPAGFARGLYYVIRILDLVLASLVLTTSTSSTELSHALNTFLKPLARFGLPSHDIATVVSIALRFIPITLNEFQQLRTAQVARGAVFDTGNLIGRLKTWTSVLVPLFVGLYRRADDLALAMDSRCYGMGQSTQLCTHALSVAQIALLVLGCAACLLLALLG